jgi:hypothetical protein
MVPMSSAYPYGQAVGVFTESGSYTVAYESWNSDQSVYDAGTYNLATHARRDLNHALGDTKTAWATGVSTDGKITGYYASDGSTTPNRGFVWTAQDGLLRSWPTADTGFTSSGVSATGLTGGGMRGADGNSHAAVWPGSGPLQDLGRSGALSIVRAVNDPGQAAGFSQAPINGVMAPVAALWCNGKEIDLTAPYEYNTTTPQVRGISPSGAAVGNYERDAVLWRDSRSYDLGGVNGISWALAVNDSDTVVGADGEEGYPYSSQAWISYAHAPAQPLQSLVPADTPWTLRLASAITPEGVIVGSATAPGAYAPYVLIPTPAQPAATVPPGSAQPECVSPAPDNTAPSVSSGPLAAFTVVPRISFSYIGHDSGSGVATFDVRYRQASSSGGFGAYDYPSGWQYLAANQVSLGAAKGSTYCFSVRARDRAGNTSGWSPERCTAVPLDDRNLTASTGWAHSTANAYYAGTMSNAVSTGRTLTRTGVHAKKIALLATTCTGCGAVAIYWNGRLIKTVSLKASTTHYKQVIVVWTFSNVSSGTIVIKTLNSGRSYIDGLGLSTV